MGVGVGAHVESSSKICASADSAWSIQLLGAITVQRHGLVVDFPASRKVRALLAYLACAQGPVSRTRLCELLWDVPNDPRGELRWCLSRLRSVLDQEQRPRIFTVGDAIALDLSDCALDIALVTQAMRDNLDNLSVEELRRLLARFRGEFAEGLEIDRNPEFSMWLNAQRRGCRDMHVAVLKHLAYRSDKDVSRSRECVEAWLQLAPFDLHAHQALLTNLACDGRVQEGDSHLAAAIRRFEAEGLEWLPLREFWKSTRNAYLSLPVFTADSVEQAPAQAGIAEHESIPTRRASVCVMPFVDRSGTGKRSTFGEGLAEDIITRLAKLRVLFVIARGSVFALGEREVPPDEAGRLLNVDYVVSGSIRWRGSALTLSVELAETRSSRVIWVDELTFNAQEGFVADAEITNCIVGHVSSEIEATERDRAVLKPPNGLDAWEAYHCGLSHMYRFSAKDNAKAAEFFTLATRRDRTFARAHAGLSFTHFQNAFLHRLADRQAEIDRAFAAAEDSLTADDRDPAAHWAMGRALWLRGLQAESLIELDQCVSLSPNFALGHYTLAFVHGQSGDPRVAIESSDWSRKLSPFDPLLFAMFSARALGHFRLGEYQDAANWAIKGAAHRNAHVHIKVIAVSCLSAAGRIDEARELIGSMHRNAPSYRLDDFLTAFRFSPEAARQFRQSAARVGLA